MPGCCDPYGFEQAFSPRFARRNARRYRRRGLDRAASRMVDFVERQGLQGASVLEIGGGVGELQLELLKRGAQSATNLELSHAYEDEAAALAAEAGYPGRVARRFVDIATEPDAVAPADVVVLHRVVCCYPDYERLLSAAAQHARRMLVFSYPPDHLAGRAVLAVQNAAIALTGSPYRAFAHPAARMLAVLERHGLHARLEHRGAVWRVCGTVRRET